MKFSRERAAANWPVSGMERSPSRLLHDCTSAALRIQKTLPTNGRWPHESKAARKGTRPSTVEGGGIQTEKINSGTPL